MSQVPEIVLGLTGSVGAYKVCDVIQELKRQGYSVTCIMSACAEKFIGKATLQALTAHKVYTELFDDNSAEIVHTKLAGKADLVLVAPATANILGKYAQGLADDLLSCTLLATEAPVLMAPAMNVHMWNNPAVQRNVELLKTQGTHFVGPISGSLACGYDGIGHIAEASEIVAAVNNVLSVKAAS